MDARNVRLKRKVTAVEPLSPQQQMVRFGLALLAVLVLFVLGVKWFAENRQGALNSSADLESHGLYLKLSMAKSAYGTSEPIDVVLQVKNISDKDTVLNFDTDLEFDFTVQSEMDLLFTQIPQNIWQYSSEPEHIPKAKAHSITIAPGKEHVFKGRWNQQMFSGAKVKPGRYIITGYLKSTNHSERLTLRGQTQK
ncbi:hypothetical protein JST97_25520 [bacterium]|nr:hypothetical protein [bacterium]